MEVTPESSSDPLAVALMMVFTEYSAPSISIRAVPSRTEMDVCGDRVTEWKSGPGGLTVMPGCWASHHPGQTPAQCQPLSLRGPE